MAHQRWPVAAGERAVPVADDQGGPDREGDQSFGAADVEWLALAAEDGGDDLGVTRQPSDGGDGQLVDGVVGQAGGECLEGGGDHESGWGAVGVGWQVGVQGVLSGLRPGRPTSGRRRPAGRGPAPRPVVFVDGGCRCGQGHERGFEEGAVLGRSAALHADSAGSVGCDREVSAQVRGTFLPVQLTFELPVRGVGVDHMHQMASRPGEVGGVEAPRMLEQGRSPRVRTAVPDGRASTAFTITSACSGDTVPAAMASRVASRGPVRAWARATTRRPSPLRRPPRWVSQSPVDP